MTINLSVSYSDLQCLVNYTNSLSERFNHAGAITSISPYDKAMYKAHLSEMLTAGNKLNVKLFGWPADQRHKKIKRVTITYMQAYIYWNHYKHDAPFILINDKIEFIAKQLTH